MVSYKLRFLFLISTILFVFHGVEEYMTDFHHIDASFRFVFSPLFTEDPQTAAFVTFQIMLWILLVISFLLLQGKKWIPRLLFIFGVVMILESHHLFEALLTQSYYPGMVTALFFPFVAFFFWKELLKESRS